MSLPPSISVLGGLPIVLDAGPIARIDLALQRLNAALQAGDPAAAAKAFESLQSNLQLPGQAAALLTGSPQFQRVLNVLHETIDSGDTAAARNTLQTLQQTLSSAKPIQAAADGRQPAPAARNAPFADDVTEFSSFAPARNAPPTQPSAAPLANSVAALDPSLALYPYSSDAATLAGRMALEPQAPLVSALAAQEAARYGVQFQPEPANQPTRIRSMLPFWILLAPIVALFLWIIL